MKKHLLAAWLLPLTLCGSPSFGQTAAAPAEPDIDVFGPAIRVTDIEKSLKFYIDGLGMKILQRLPEGKGEAVLLVPKGRALPPMIDLLQTVKGDPSKSEPVVLGNGYSRTILSVKNSGELWAHLKAAGFAPTGDGKGQIFFVKDPDGYSYEITQRGMATPKAR